MKKIHFNEALALIVQEDARYDQAAYHFVREGLDYTIRKLEKPVDGPGRHVSGQELLAGLRDYAIQEYGPLARRVLAHWGIRRCEDFGEMVFNLVNAGVLGKTDNDHKSDFTGGYDFETAFTVPFVPERVRDRTAAPSSASRGMSIERSS